MVGGGKRGCLLVLKVCCIGNVSCTVGQFVRPLVCIGEIMLPDEDIIVMYLWYKNEWVHLWLEYIQYNIKIVASVDHVYLLTQ